MTTLFTEQEMKFDIENQTKTFHSSQKVKLFRHTDLDGVGTEIVTRLFFKDVYATRCDYHNVNSNILAFIEGGEYIHYDHIIVADISFNEEIAELIYNNENLRNRFMLVDHHKTAEWLNKYPFSIVEVVRNGKLASGTSSLYEILKNYEIPYYSYNVNDNAVQSFVEKVRRYDTWDWKNVYNDNKAKRLNDLFYKMGEREFIADFESKLFSSIHRFIDGEWVMFNNNQVYFLDMLEKETDNYIDSKIKKAKYGTHEDKVYAYVIAENHISELGNAMCERLDIEFAVILDASRNKVSLRSKSAGICDVSEIAKAVGGGGHVCASGYEISLSWDELVRLTLNGKTKKEDKPTLKQKFKNWLDNLIN